MKLISLADFIWLLKTTPCSNGESPKAWLMSQCSTLFCFECWCMFQNPMNIHKHGMALKGQSGLCFVASALGSEWQCLAPSSSPMLGDYQRQNGVCVHRVNTRRYLCRLTHKKGKNRAMSHFPMLWNTTKTERKANLCIWFHILQK